MPEFMACKGDIQHHRFLDDRPYFCGKVCSSFRTEIKHFRLLDLLYAQQGHKPAFHGGASYKLQATLAKAICNL